MIYLIFVIWAQARFHSYKFALDYVMGTRLQVEPSPLLLGPRRINEQFDTAIRLQNHSGKPVTILGAMVACPCVANRGLPRTVPPGEVVVLPISVRVGTVPGEWRQAVRYLTNLPGQLDVVIELRGEVIAAAAVPARAQTEAIP